VNTSRREAGGRGAGDQSLDVRDDVSGGHPHDGDDPSDDVFETDSETQHDRKATVMSDDAYQQSDYQTSGSSERTGWTGWITFAGVMMIISGALNALYGLIAAVNDEWVVWTNRASLYIDISQWGWVHMILGVVMVLSGFGVFSGNILARTVGVIAASLSLIANFFFIPAYPLWALAVVTIDVLVIWALTAHGSEMRKA
jgi:uncharacterized membrane protein